MQAKGNSRRYCRCRLFAGASRAGAEGVGVGVDQGSEASSRSLRLGKQGNWEGGANEGGRGARYLRNF